MGARYARQDIKAATRANWHGCCNVTLPSYTEDFSKLNHAAVRHDVARSAEFGFWGTLIASECGLTVDEYVEFMEVAADAAPEGFSLVAHPSFDTLDDVLRVSRAATQLGFEANLLPYPQSLRVSSARDVVEWTKLVAEGSDLALIVFAVATWGYRSISPASFPHEAIEELAKLETVAAVKYEANPPGIVTGLTDVYRRCGEDVIVQCPMEHTIPAMIESFGMQWVGTSGYESFGDRVPRWFSLLHEGRWSEGMELYWSYQAAREAKGAWAASWSGANLIHRNGWKYLSWLQGFNGGLLRMPQMRLSAGQMRQLRGGIEASGFDVPSDDAAFFAGRNPA